MKTVYDRPAVDFGRQFLPCYWLHFSHRTTSSYILTGRYLPKVSCGNNASLNFVNNKVGIILGANSRLRCFDTNTRFRIFAQNDNCMTYRTIFTKNSCITMITKILIVTYFCNNIS